MDASTRAAIAEPITVQPVVLGTDLATDKLAASVVYDAVRPPNLIVIDATLDESRLPVEADALLIRAEDYVEVLLAREKLSDVVGLERKALLDFEIHGAGEISDKSGVTLFVDPIDPATGREQAAGFVRQGGDWEFVSGVEQQIGTAERGCLVVRAGRYRVFLDDTISENVPWQCDAVVVDVPGSVSLRCEAGGELTLLLPSAGPAVAWLRSPGGSTLEVETDSAACHIPTRNLKDGHYEVGASGADWRAVPASVEIRAGASRPARLRLETVPTQAARIVVEPGARAARVAIARVRADDSMDWLSGVPDAEGFDVVRDESAFIVTGIANAPLEFIVVDQAPETRSARTVLVSGAGTYVVELPQVALRLVANAAGFVERFTERHGKAGASFRVQAAVALPGNRSVWLTIADRDFVSNPAADPLSAAEWRIPFDIAMRGYRLCGYVVAGGKTELIETAEVQWQ